VVATGTLPREGGGIFTVAVCRSGLQIPEGGAGGEEDHTQPASISSSRSSHEDLTSLKEEVRSGYSGRVECVGLGTWEIMWKAGGNRGNCM